MEKLFYRNPETGLIEFKEEFFKPAKIHRYVRTDDGVKLKEFASDAALALLRISDPVLTALVQGYTNAELIGDKLMTPVRVTKETGRFPAFGKEVFVMPNNLKRAIGQPVQRIVTQSGYIPLSLDEYALGVGIENRERNEWAGAPEMLLNGKILQVTSKIALYREYLQAVGCTTAGNYAVSGAAKAWGGAGSGDPVKDFDDLQEILVKKNGRMGNVGFFSWGAWVLFKNNSAVLNRIKYGGSPITPAQMTARAAAELLQVDEVVIGKANYAYGLTQGKFGGDAVTQAFIWDSVQSNNAGILIRGSGGGIEPAFGYTWERLNSPVVESYYENQTKQQIYDYEHFFTPAVTLNTAGAFYYSLA